MHAAEQPVFLQRYVTEKPGYQSPYGGMDNGVYGVAATSCAAALGQQPDRRHHTHHQQHADVPPQWVSPGPCTPRTPHTPMCRVLFMLFNV
ncbi:unnamed protein product [Colias eurytheme]|nr:unnamed protein product [Colias eurytheme]